MNAHLTSWRVARGVWRDIGRRFAPLATRHTPLLLLAIVACAPVGAGTRPAPIPDARPPAPINPALPAIPLATGPLAINVVYPRADAVVQSRDSAFIMGSVGHGDAFLTINGIPAAVWPNGAFMAFLPVPPVDRPAYEIEARVGREVVRLSHPVRLPPPPTTAVTTVAPTPDTMRVALSRFGVIGGAREPGDTTRIIWGRAVPDPSFTRFLFLPGTIVRVIDTTGGSARVQLDDSTVAILPLRDVVIQADSFAPPTRTAGGIGVRGSTESVDATIPMSAPPPYLATVDGNTLRLTLFSTQSTAPGASSGAVVRTPVFDSLLMSIEHRQAGPRAEYTFTLRRRVFGYLVEFGDSALTVRIRRPPVVDPAAPLRGLTIAVDPGHPGAPGESPGATGPTGLLERDAVLAVGLRLRDMLQERGANVLMTRSTPDPVPLNDRAHMALRGNAHAFVSIHLDAVPDNVNPFSRRETGTYYLHGNSQRFAELTVESLVRHMHLRNRGHLRENFAVIRVPWFPSILTEGAFIIIPDQEYALRTPEYQAAYARGIMEGLERFFAEIAVGW